MDVAGLYPILLTKSDTSAYVAVTSPGCKGKKFFFAFLFNFFSIAVMKSSKWTGWLFPILYRLKGAGEDAGSGFVKIDDSETEVLAPAQRSQISILLNNREVQAGYKYQIQFSTVNAESTIFYSAKLLIS